MSADLDLLEAACRGAGAIARRRFEQGCRAWNKKGGSPVTEADLEVDAYLKGALTAARPDHGWLSEESVDNAARLSRRTLFIVDPIDGTVAFLKGRPHFTICAAIVTDGVPACGVVYNPMLDHLYKAQSGGGAFRNGEAIHVAGPRKLEGCAMLGDRSVLVRSPFPPMTVETRNSVAYRVALVAEGLFDATVSLSAKRDWDLAACDVILSEAGGRISDRGGRPLRYNRADACQHSLVAAAPALHAQILALLA